MICIRSQPANLRHIIKAAIRTITGDAMADDAYPPAETIHVYYQKVLLRSLFFSLSLDLILLILSVDLI